MSASAVVAAASAAPAPRTSVRTDIQALRGLAVVLVLLFHARLSFPRAGYLGVDIFFVISGYLITRLISEPLIAGNFSFRAFYVRRAKRLLPAAYATFLATTFASVFFLTQTEAIDYTKQLLGALTFTGNIVLWLQTGYFASAADLKPLLHVWSLSIEEQYYLLLPAMLVFAPRRFWKAGALLLCLISLILCLVFVTAHPAATFYLLPTRAWEMLLGSVGTLALDRPPVRRALSPFSWIAAALLILIPAFPLSPAHPGVDALIVCIATLVVILCRSQTLNAMLVSRWLAKMGDWSYSLYLVHWPLFAFAGSAYLSGIPHQIRVYLILTSVCLGYLLYRTVERPLRHGLLRLSATTAFASTGVLLALPLLLAYSRRQSVDYATIRRINFGFSSACEYPRDFSPKAECRNADHPRILVWGDSYAMHLVPGIAATTELGVMQVTQSACGPLSDLAPLDQERNRIWGQGCLSFTKSVLDYLSQPRTPDLIVLSSTFSHYVMPEPGKANSRLLMAAADGAKEVPVDIETTIRSMRATIVRIRALGKKVVVVAPPPRASFDIGLCLERRHSGKVIRPAALATCEVPVPEYRRDFGRVLELLRRLPTEANVAVISFDSLLCSQNSCVTEIDSTFLYRDSGHLSYDGSVLLARRSDLVKQIVDFAR